MCLFAVQRGKATVSESPVRNRNEPGVVAHIYPPHSGGRGKGISEFEASLVFRVSSRITRDTEKPFRINPNFRNGRKSNALEPSFFFFFF